MNASLMVSRFLWFAICWLFLLFSGLASAHDAAESTVTARIQHNRLEVVVTMTQELAASLIGEGATDPEASPQINAETLDTYRERLQQKALNLYDVTAGSTPLTAKRAAASITEQGHLQLVIFYPEPADWPLRFHARTFENAPGYYTSSLEVFDQDEKLLGKKLLAPQYSAIADLSIDPNAPPPPPPTPAPSLAPPVIPPAPAPIPHWSWFKIGSGTVAGLAILFAALLLNKARKSPHQ